MIWRVLDGPLTCEFTCKWKVSLCFEVGWMGHSPVNSQLNGRYHYVLKLMNKPFAFEFTGKIEGFITFWSGLGGPLTCEFACTCKIYSSRGLYGVGRLARSYAVGALPENSQVSWWCLMSPGIGWLLGTFPENSQVSTRTLYSNRGLYGVGRLARSCVVGTLKACRNSLKAFFNECLQAFVSFVWPLSLILNALQGLL